MWINDRKRRFVLVLVVVLFALAVRLPAAGTFATVDEENWTIRSADFYHQLFREGDPGGTFITTHPGATAMWIIGAGVAVQEARVGFDVDTSNITAFRKAATWPVVIVVSILIGLITWMLIRLFGVHGGVIAGGLLAVEPYIVGMSQVAHLDMLLALLMLISLLGYFCFMREGRWRWLVVAGIFAGFAMGVKLLPALWLFVFFAIVSLWPRIPASAGQVRRAPHVNVKRFIRSGGFVFGVAVLTFWLIWPALWVKADLSKSFEKDVPAIVQDAHVDIVISEEAISPTSFYARSLMGRTTPFVLILVIGALIMVIRQLPHFATLRLRSGPKEASRGLHSTEHPQSYIFWLFVYMIGFLLLITFVSKKADRYALPALVVLPIVAGWALAQSRQYISSLSSPPPASGTLRSSKMLRVSANGPQGLRLRSSRSSRDHARSASQPVRRILPTLLGVGIVVLLVGQVLVWSPYTIAYNNPIFNVRPSSQQGWGEGLDVAAEWLNQQPVASEMFVASWYQSVMRTYFVGKTLSLSSRNDDRIAFVITYRNMYGRAPDDIASNVIDEYSDRKPAHVISIQGKPYVWIYNVMGIHYFPEHVGELKGDLEVGQIVPVLDDGWSAIEIGMATFSSRNNTQDVILHVRESIDGEDLRTVKVNASVIVDSSYHRFDFEPIEDSAGKEYYVLLSSPTSTDGDAVTIRFSNHDLVPGEMVKNGDVLGDRDVAYGIFDK